MMKIQIVFMRKTGLLITDMSREELAEQKGKYEGWTILSPEKDIHPCIGCFSCWKKTPGRCVIKDGYDQMAALINEAEEIVYNSRYTYGGFSRFVKNVFDRSIGYVLPYFEVSEHEMHHKRRYQDIKEITFIFRGNALSEEDKACAEQYVHAVCRNMRNRVKEVLFEEDASPVKAECREAVPASEKLILLNCSIRGKNANSETFLTNMADHLQKEYRFLRLSEYQNREEELVDQLMQAETLVLAMPLYVDGLPSTVIHLLDRLKQAGFGTGRKVYVLANLGLYESHQMKNLLSMMRAWCGVSGCAYSGSVVIGAGELIGVLIRHMKSGPVRGVTKALEALAENVTAGAKMDDLYVQPLMFPRWLYIQIANRSWDRQALASNMKPADLKICPQYEE